MLIRFDAAADAERFFDASLMMPYFHCRRQA